MKRLAVLISAGLLAAVLAIAATPAGACAAGRRPLPRGPAVASVKGETWWTRRRHRLDARHDGLRAPAGRARRACTPTTTTTARATPASRRTTARATARYALAVDTRLLPEGENRVDIRFSLVGVHQRPGVGLRLQVPGPGARLRAQRRGQRGRGDDRRRRSPSSAPGQINGLIWDDKDDDGHREAGEDGVEQLARLPRRRPRRQARRRRAATRTRRTSPASTSCPSRRATSRGRRRAAAARARAPRRRRLHGAVRVRDHRADARGRAA